ncbi:MAG TPA: DMT family transporter, partial [Candidatus Saccharimonadia bacterium]|nr:DMT family transporter [Candidatus Saccharimonadia bacterium]
MTPRTRSLLALIAGAIGIGFAPIFVRFSEVGPSATAFWRITLALPMMGLWAAGTGGGFSKPNARSWLVLGLVGATFAIDLAIWHWSIKFTSVANATLEANLASIFVVLMGWLLFGTKVSRRFLGAMVVALAGTALLVGKNAYITPDTLKGDALGVLSGVFYAGYILSVKAARDRGLSTVTIMIVSGVLTATLLLPGAWLSGEVILPATSRGWLTVAGLALVSQFGGQTLIAYALARLPAAPASLGLLIQPATAAI